MSDIVERLRFDAVRCEVQFSKGVAGNIEEAAKEIERLRAAYLSHLQMENACRRTGIPCVRHPEKCGCALELRDLLSQQVGKT